MKLLEIPAPGIESAVDAEVAEGELVADTVDAQACVFLAALHRAERSIAAHIGRLNEGRPPWGPVDTGKAIPWVEKKLSITLADSQKQALRLVS